MRSTLVLATFASLVYANDQTLLPRHGGLAFQPVVGQVVDNCALPCGEHDCLLGSRGDTCCSEGYACPGGNFCLTAGYCCPNGADPATCAQQNGVTLPPGFKPGQTVVVTPASTSAAVPSSTAEPPVINKVLVNYTAASTESPIAYTTTTPIAFEGAASIRQIVTGSGVLTLLIGFAGLMI